MAAVTTRRRECGSRLKPMSQKLVPVTSRGSGWRCSPWACFTMRRNGSARVAVRNTRQISLSSIATLSQTWAVTRMPRTASTEVTLRATSLIVPRARSSWRISAVWRCPVAAKLCMAPLRWGWCDVAVGSEPAAEEPIRASTTIGMAGSTRPARTKGARARMLAVATQPPMASRSAVTICSRCSSASPYTKLESSSGRGCSHPYQRG